MTRSAGKPTHLDAKLPLYLGVDVGGTGIKIGLVDDQGQTLDHEAIETRETDGPVAAMRQVADVYRRFLARTGLDSRDVLACGLGAPGPMDVETGLLVAPPQLPSWSDFPLRDCLAECLGLPVAFLNDANAAAFGEHWLGGGQAARSMVLLTLGTGVGGGILADGRLVHGTNSFGGEFGHLIVNPAADARLCAWGGGRGQLEAYASAAAVTLRTRQRLQDGAVSALRRLTETVTPLDVYHAAQDGDGLALELIDEAADWLSIGVTTIVHVLDPGVVVIGGAMTFGGEGCPIGQRFLKGVTQGFRERTFENVFAGTHIGFARLGADAGYLGAAGYARQQSRTAAGA
ncbi:MAG: ROK family protein [Planctomycetaceae bacterium]|nr:MAG: ROK family protein [Planctomycetaceae bacterium]